MHGDAQQAATFATYGRPLRSKTLSTMYYCTDSNRRCREAGELVEDGVGGLGPDEWSGALVVFADVAVDGLLEVGDGLEDATPDAPAGDGGKEALDGVDPGCRGGHEVKHPARMIGNLFDKGYISFADDGTLLISPHIDPIDLERLGVAADVSCNVGSFTDGQRSYLAYHRAVIFLA